MKNIALASVLIALTVFGCGRARVNAIAPKRTATLTADDIARAPALSIEQLLMARVPGLTLSRAPDGHLALHIRSSATEGQEREPLFVVNGIPLGNAANFAAISRFDIASVEVVSDPGRAAMYGSQGANGVILVTTKGS